MFHATHNLPKILAAKFYPKIDLVQFGETLSNTNSKVRTHVLTRTGLVQNAQSSQKHN